MNEKSGILVSLVLLGTFVGGVFATTAPGSPSTSLTPQITSVDVQALNVIPGNGNGVITLSPGPVNAPPAAINLTLGFSFAPVKGFTQITSVLLTLIYSLNGGGNANDAISVELNSRPPILFPVSASVTSGTSGPGVISGLESVPTQMIGVGSNSINIGISRGGTNTSVYNIFQIRLTLQYTYLG